MQNHLLLLGAGFSRNWGGWLATEADEYLMGHASLDDSIRDLLWQHRRSGGFESALAKLQQEDSTGERLVHLQKALVDMFMDMDSGFSGLSFNFNHSAKNSVSNFLTRFDAIFSLNQDLLLERHYHKNDDVALCSNGKWSSYTLPGIAKKNDDPDSWGGLGVWEPLGADYQIDARSQPYFKLHGSANWHLSGAKELLVMGGNKAGMIASFPILQRYQTDFLTRLTTPNSKLMIIGYSFGDNHINNAICNAVTSAKLKTFIIDPLGADVFDKNRDAMIYQPDELAKKLRPSVIGASRRSLREVFGTDRVEYEKVMRFFTSEYA
jgi:SIR2-like domain